MGKKNRNKQLLQAVAVPDIKLKPEALRSIWILVLLVLGLVGLLGLFNLSGAVGQFLSKQLTLAFGIGKWFVPPIFILWAFFLYKGKRHHITLFNYLGLALFFLSLETIFHWFIESNNWQTAVISGHGGGYLGMFLTKGLSGALGFWGGLIILFALFFSSLILVFNTPIHSLISPLRKFYYFLKNKFVNEYITDDSSDDEADEDEVEEDLDKNNKNSLAPEENLVSNNNFKTRPIKVDPQVKEILMEEFKVGKKPARVEVPLNLLAVQTGLAQSGDIEKNAVLIQKTLENFGIPVEMSNTSVGPTVTQYTFKPAEGIKVARITTLSNDLSLSLAAHPIRIEAPIPGKALVGIEVPNKTKAMVGLREILEDKQFKLRGSNMTAAIGKDVSGANWFYDITKMPHVLVAGATNSGKSVCLNTIIISLLYQNGPDSLRFIMVDPKRVELPVYNGIPHLLTPVITDVTKTVNALKWCLNEMDRRYDILNKAGKKNIQSYNVSRSDKMSYIVFVIDELADLMVVAAKEIEGSIIRLTQMSRAVGIHLILATQRPSVDVITGLIKANVPARIAFSVASAIDSKTILDCSGAEKLLGKGDMLFSAAEMSKPKRLQGAFVSDEEILRITDYIKDRSGEAEYEESVVEKQKVKGFSGFGFDAASGNSGDDDELLEEAKKAIIQMGRASTSLLQRRLRIGYGRAASILDALEDAGVVGPPNGSKPREVLISGEDYEDMPISGLPLHKKEEIVEEYDEDDILDLSENSKVEEEDENIESEVSDFASVLAAAQTESKSVNKKDIEDDGKYFSR
jgi:S-DNA-T family DNA segregation ATPase FtsK/SpoIIIE